MVFLKKWLNEGEKGHRKKLKSKKNYQFRENILFLEMFELNFCLFSKSLYYRVLFYIFKYLIVIIELAQITKIFVYKFRNMFY